MHAYRPHHLAREKEVSMRRLRPTDGTPVHKRAARYHDSKLVADGGPLHQQLHGEMAPLLATLIAKERAVDDARDAAVAAQALEDHHETNFENLIRDIDADLGKLDRVDATLNARATVFRDGFGKEIEPDGDAQVAITSDLRDRLAKFAGQGVVADHLTKFDVYVEALKNAVSATNAAEDLVDKVFAEENEARRAIREQLESAYGRLRAHYKATPAKAETFFLREGSRRAAKSE
jgi:hypothetical protein